MDDELDETQWTDAARESYAASAEALIAEIRRHVELTTGREGRQRELGPWFESAEEVHEAAVAFTHAELDWCGSTSIKVRIDEDDWDDDEDDDEEDEEVGDVLSVVGRWDFRVTDPEAFVEAGRRAYAEAWPDDTAEDAEIAVPDVGAAVAALMHPPTLDQLEGAEGLDMAMVWAETYLHDGSETDEEDPFAIVHESRRRG
ncbi:hypothetical protein N798_01065 [Knoellia flava TL1]|uniref:Uncharacterized protein n=2 Tax=Knoellia flava TaxID=913969 RepID=A0A8H9FU16_9MICO|nr:hypothetical protein [Knoellia flava]KGN36043.1 hypothetical protein N798_01065 [Knoellia flava TL1]GGB80090.1 hypothetical protein GCM10011314_19640 [Knoellia flava]